LLLPNRRSFDKALTRELTRCARDGLPLALLLVDVDHFKSYNDSYGHQEGDECLKRLSHLLRGMARRPGDVAARYGGEEFAVILPNTSAEGGRHFAESLRAAVEALNIPHCRSRYGVVTVSIGLACELPIAGTEAAMLQNADAALYSAKENRRNAAENFGGATLAVPRSVRTSASSDLLHSRAGAPRPPCPRTHASRRHKYAGRARRRSISASG
jgi:diguanylate cyclase (GGDEF)-like protein